MVYCRFLGSNLRVLPVRNNTEIVKGMLTIAKVRMKEDTPKSSHIILTWILSNNNNEKLKLRYLALVD